MESLQSPFAIEVCDCDAHRSRVAQTDGAQRSKIPLQPTIAFADTYAHARPTTLMLTLPKNFFVQPVTGITERYRGRTAAELVTYEQVLGVQFPQAFKELYAVQNGGSINYETISGQESVSLYGGFSPFRPERGAPLANMHDIILATHDEADIAVAREVLGFFAPERLLVFAPMDGHSFACLDYGYRLRDAREEPRVVFVTGDDDQFCGHGEFGPSFETFSDLLANLERSGDARERTFIALSSALSYGEVMDRLAVALGVELEAQTDDCYGSFDFELWHRGAVPILLDDETLANYAHTNGTTLEATWEWVAREGRERKILSFFSPNQYRSGAFRFQDHAHCSVIIEVTEAWFATRSGLGSVVEQLARIDGINGAEFVF